MHLVKWEVWRLLTHEELPSVDPVCSDARRWLKIDCFLQLQSMGQGSTSDQRLIQNMPCPELYLLFIRVMYMLSVALFAVLK